MISDDHSLGGSYRDTILRGYQLLERNKREKGSLRETNGEKKYEVVEKKKKKIYMEKLLEESLYGRNRGRRL